jgi:hypothetical protein
MKTRSFIALGGSCLLGFCLSAAEADLAVPARSKVEAGPGDARDKLQAYTAGVSAAREKEFQEAVARWRKDAADELQREEAAKREREKRRQEYEKYWGVSEGLEHGRSAEKAARFRLTFVIPEAEVYAVAGAACRERERFLKDAAAKISALAADRDGLVSGDEYQAAASLVSAAAAPLGKEMLDRGGELRLSDLRLLRPLAVASGEVLAGRNARIEGYDRDGDGRLSLEERKDLALAFASAAMRWGDDARFYEQAVLELRARAEAVSERYASVELGASGEPRP